ncbi:hypothetical protein ACFC14_18180 [Microbacterium sp. NPDC055988]|uniref:hypothetical protein n=1 Tax=Microbacterium sp. NPDC055988 TaxID=3345671 RepID=UPI0035DAE609
MPREQITHNRIMPQPSEVPVGTSTPDGETVAPAIVQQEVARRNLHVRWNRDAGWIQVAVDMTVAEIRSLLEHAEHEATAAARANEHIGEYFTEQHQVKVWSDVLDRGETNKAILALRRARDAAYGKDA